MSYTPKDRFGDPMETRETKTLSLTPELASFLEACVASGRYQSASEVVRAALRLLEHEEETRKAVVQKVRQMIEVGAQELDRGEVVDGEQVFRRLRARRERMRRDSQAQP